jgi:hypothetical protein
MKIQIDNITTIYLEQKIALWTDFIELHTNSQTLDLPPCPYFLLRLLLPISSLKITHYTI